MKLYIMGSVQAEAIPYIPGLREVTGSIPSAILMMQLESCFRSHPSGFHKFLEPPQEFHPDYVTGNSWTEELAFSKDEFRAAFDRIGVRWSSKTQFEEAKQSGLEFGGKYYCSYYDRRSGRTFYYRNHERLAELAKRIQQDIAGGAA